MRDAASYAGLVGSTLALIAVWSGEARAAEPVQATEQMVVTANPYASEAGIRILRAGGSAVGAAIAVQLVLSLVEPQSSGVGGGAFMLVHDRPDEPGEPTGILAYEGREMAPAAVTPGMFLDENGGVASFLSVAFGGLPVGVPGAMRMLDLAHRDHGRLPWAELFVPAIELAERGFEVSPRLYFLLERFRGIAQAERFRSYFYDGDGEPREIGFRLVNADFAATLRLLAAQGAEPMYSGELAERIVEAVTNNAIRQGSMTLEDLASYDARTTTPVCSPYRQWRVCGPRPPSSGGMAVQQILGILEAYAPPDLTEDPVRSIHLIAEASRLAFADRWGDAVSMTTTVQGAFGSQLMVGGFILNNQLTDFSFVPEVDGRVVANRAEPRKRPLSSMSPSLVYDAQGRLRLLVGSPGGTRIINYVAQTIVAVLDRELNV